MLGAGVGASVGEEDGEVVGLALGAIEGEAVGLVVGASVGGDGAFVGVPRE
jgi:hypothetical protein